MIGDSRDGGLAQWFPSLLGMDVGFATDRKTTGLAWRVDGHVEVAVAGTQWEARRAVLPQDMVFDLAALDAPVVSGLPETTARACEAVLYRGPFWNRCRPGLSHHGRGLNLRRAGAHAAHQIQAVLAKRGLPVGPEAVPGVPVIEAFPNAFLGVMLPPDIYAAAPRLRRGARFDWLYEQALEAHVLHGVLAELRWDDAKTNALFDTETHHDKRAALVCLLTAGFAHDGRATVIGDVAGGWLWLPPARLWDDWARAGLKQSLTQSRKRGFPDACVWSSDHGLILERGPMALTPTQASATVAPGWAWLRRADQDGFEGHRSLEVVGFALPAVVPIFKSPFHDPNRRARLSVCIRALPGLLGSKVPNQVHFHRILTFQAQYSRSGTWCALSWTTTKARLIAGVRKLHRLSAR